MKKDLTFQALSLFSQDLGQIEPIFQKTACMNVDDAETIGMLEGIKVFLDEEKDKEFFAFLAKAQAFMELLGYVQRHASVLVDAFRPQVTSL